MRVTKTIRPGEPGSQRYVRRFGQRLIAVRYRKSKDEQIIYTTVELIAETRDYKPGVDHGAVIASRDREWVALRIDYNDHSLRAKLKAAGAAHVEHG